MPTQDIIVWTHLHEAFTLKFLHFVSSTVQPLPLWIQHWISHLPPCPAVQHKSQSHHTRHGNQHCIHGLVLAVNLEDSQQGHSSDQASQDEEEDHKWWNAACLLPFLFACFFLSSQKSILMFCDIKIVFMSMMREHDSLYLECPLS